MSLSEIDVITFFDKKEKIDISFTRRSLYSVDKQFWQLIVDPGSSGFSSDKKELEIIDPEDLHVSIQVMRILTHEDITIGDIDIMKALLFLKRMEGPLISKLQDSLYSRLKNLSIEDIVEYIDPPFEDLLPAKFLEDKCRNLALPLIKTAGWKIIIRNHKILGFFVPITRIWVFLKAFEHGYIKRLPALDLEDRAPWLETPVWMHPFMWQSRKYEDMGLFISTVSVKDLKDKIEKICPLQDLYSLIVSRLKHKDIYSIASIMYVLILSICRSHTKDTMQETLDTIIKVLECKYDTLSEHDTDYIIYHQVDPKHIISCIISLDDKMLKYALMHPLTYAFAETQNWYANYADHMKKLCYK